MEAEGLEFHPGNNCIVLTGTYDPKTMKFERETARSLDYGLDFYAPQTMGNGGWPKSYHRLDAVLREGFPAGGLPLVRHLKHPARAVSGKMAVPCQRPVRNWKNYRRKS